MKVRFLARLACGLLLIGLGAAGVAQQDSAGSSTDSSNLARPNVVKKIDKRRYLWPGPGIVAPKPLAESIPPFQGHAPKGKTVLCIGIGDSGRVEQIEILKSLTREFDDYAVETASQWRFVPAMKDGRAVPVYINADFDSKKVEGKADAP